MSLVALARHIAIALQDDGEVLLCTEDTPRIWESLGVVLLRGSLLFAASDRDILATDLPVMKSLAAKLVAQGRVSMVSVGNGGMSS